MSRNYLRELIRSRNGRQVVPRSPEVADIPRCPVQPEWWVYELSSDRLYVRCVAGCCAHGCGRSYIEADWLPAPEQLVLL